MAKKSWVIAIKKPLPTWKVEAQETKRKKYEKIIKDISSDKPVYIDESVIEAGIAKDRGWCLKDKKLSSKRSGKYR